MTYPQSSPDAQSSEGRANPESVGVLIGYWITAFCIAGVLIHMTLAGLAAGLLSVAGLLYGVAVAWSVLAIYAYGRAYLKTRLRVWLVCLAAELAFPAALVWAANWLSVA